MIMGGCRCGAIRYEAEVTAPDRHSVCHCADCRRSAGAPMVAWLAVPEDTFRVSKGQVRCWEGSNGALRYFCATCGTGLYYRNEDVIPGIVDLQSATLDEPEAYAPAAQIQCAERLGWVTGLNDLPAFERWPGS